MTYKPTKADLKWMDEMIAADDAKAAAQKASSTSSSAPWRPHSLKDWVGIDPLVTMSTPRSLKEALMRTTESPLDRELRNVTPGIVNPWIEAANLLPGVNISLMKPENENAMTTTVGKVAGSIFPFLTGEGAVAGVARSLPTLAENAGATGELTNALHTILSPLTKASPVRSALVGGATGYATSPDPYRKKIALESALGSGATHAVGGLVGTLFHQLPLGSRVQKAAQLYQTPLNGEPEDALKDATNEIASNYIKNLRKSRDLYKNATFAANLHGIKFKAKDFPEYTKVYNQLKSNEELPTGVRPPDKMDQTEEEGGEVLPSMIHKRRSELLRKARTGMISGFDKRAYNKLGNALLTDYITKMDEINPSLSQNYMKANNFYREMIAKNFHGHKAFKKMKDAIEELPGGSDNEEKNLFRLNWRGKRITPIINNLVPKDGTEGMSALQSFKNDLMGGNHEKTAQLAKKLMFSKYAHPLNGDATAEEIETPSYKFNIYKFLNHYNKLSDDQRNFLFSPQEKKTLDIFSAYRNKLKEPSRLTQLAKKGLGASIGYLIGAHTLGNLGGKIGGELAGAALAEPVERGATLLSKALMPSDINELIRHIGPYHPSFKATRLPAAIVPGGLQTFQGVNNAKE